MRRVMKLKDYSFRTQIIGWQQPTYKSWLQLLKNQTGHKYTQILEKVSLFLSNGLVQGSKCPPDVDVYIEDLPNVDLKLYNAVMRAIAEELGVSPMVVAKSLLEAVRRLLPERPFINKVGYVVYYIDHDSSILAVKLSANYTNRKYAYLLLDLDQAKEARRIKALPAIVHEQIVSRIRNDVNVPLNTLMRFSEKKGWVKEGNNFNFNTENYLRISGVL